MRSVQANETGDSIYRVTFLDENEKEIDCYNPFNHAREGPVHKLAANEQLIGVYGVRNKNNPWFSSFGSIVKVKHE